MSGNEIVDASSLVSEYLVHISTIGQASKRLASFRWRTKSIGGVLATTAGLQFHRPVEGALIQYRMACYLILPYTSSLIVWQLQLLNQPGCINIYYFSRDLMANIFGRIITRLYSLRSIRETLLGSILISSSWTTPNDQLISFCDSTLGRRSWQT
jgi:hypothetical protein